MANQTQQSKSAAGATPKKKFADMSAGGKIAYVGKIVIFLITFGFAFPTLFSD